MAAYMHVSLVNQREHLQERLLLPKVRGYISNTEKMDAVSILYILKNETYPNRDTKALIEIGHLC